VLGGAFRLLHSGNGKDFPQLAVHPVHPSVEHASNVFMVVTR
jgi:hypothetical protein